MREQFYNGDDDCKWLLETALRGYSVPAFQSFTLAGNEDCPLGITLYANAEPTVSDLPVSVYTLVTNPHSNLSTYQVQS